MSAPRTLPEARRVWRIGDPHGRYPVWSVEGARRVAGRWHEAGQCVVYAAESYSLALLEKLAHWRQYVPPNQHAVEVELPVGLSYEVVNRDAIPGWNAPGGDAARAFGARWFEERRSAVLFVPSVIAPMEANVVVHGLHEDFRRLSVGLEIPVRWDERLFESTSA